MRSPFGGRDPKSGARFQLVNPMRRSLFSPRWPLVVVPRGHGKGRLPTRAIVAGTLLIAFAVGGAIVSPGAGWIRVLVATGISSLVLLTWVWALVRERSRSDGFIELTEGGLRRVTAKGSTSLVEWSSPFGVTILASYGRPVGLLAFTTPTQTRYVPLRLDGRTDEEDALFARIGVLADLDLVDAILHDAALSPTDGANILRAVEERHPNAFRETYLSDGRGAPIWLERGNLIVGTRSFDLSGPLEWRTLMFHESTGHGAALYQATWVRQSGRDGEVVFVAPMPSSIIPTDSKLPTAPGPLARALVSDLKLLQAPSENPPVREQRIPIDRPFMIALRRALAKAPLATRVVPTTPTRRSERRI